MFDALLLLPAFPFVFTFMKFVELEAFGDRSHQLLATSQIADSALLSIQVPDPFPIRCLDPIS